MNDYTKLNIEQVMFRQRSIKHTWETEMEACSSISISNFMRVAIEIHSSLLEEDYYFDLVQGVTQMAIEIGELPPEKQATAFFGTLECNLNEPERCAELDNEILLEITFHKDKDGKIKIESHKYNFRTTPTRQQMEQEEGDWED